MIIRSSFGSYHISAEFNENFWESSGWSSSAETLKLIEPCQTWIDAVAPGQYVTGFAGGKKILVTNKRITRLFKLVWEGSRELHETGPAIDAGMVYAPYVPLTFVSTTAQLAPVSFNTRYGLL